MTDIHNPQVRSYNMSRIGQKNTKPELIVRKYLFTKGLRYRTHGEYLPSKPDIILPKYKTVVFINGCFWHGHQGCKYFGIPKTRPDYWKSKIYKTRSRDKRNTRNLEELGWKVIVVWECEIKHNIEKRLAKLEQEIKSNFL